MLKSKGWFGTGVALTGLYLAIGCTSTTTGNEGNFDFSYTADDQVTNFNKPIAVGAKLELRVLETGSRLKVEVEDATTDDEEVVAVETFSSNRIILLGKGEGNVLVEVTAKTPDGETLTDSVNMLAAVPTTLELRHSCTVGSDTPKYFVGTDGMLVGFDMKMSNSQNVIGYGYFPVELSGDAELTLNQTTTDQANFHFNIGDTAGVATISSTIDDTTLDVVVVTEAEIDGIEVSPSADLQLHVGETEFYHFWPTVAGDRVCQSEAEIQAETSTPNICDVRAGQPLDGDSAGSLDITGWVAVEGKEFGNCLFTVTYPAASDGEGMTVDFEAEVGDFPDASNNGSM